MKKQNSESKMAVMPVKKLMLAFPVQMLMVISICRQILFVLPPAWGIAGIAAGNNDKIWVVWCTFIIAEVMSFIIAALFMKKIYKRKIKTM